MTRSYTIIDLERGDWYVGIKEALEKGEVSALLNNGEFGLRAYVPSTKWDKEKVLALLKKYDLKYNPETKEPNEGFVVHASNPDETVLAFLKEFTKEVAQDPTLEFRIKDLCSEEQRKLLDTKLGKHSFDDHLWIYGIRNTWKLVK